jgi:hypothetical protein
MIDLVLSNTDLDAILDSFKGIPFGNSDFQNKMFVMNDQITPCRMFRAVALRLRDRINALREAYYSLKKEDIDILEMHDKLAGDILTKYERMRMEVELEQRASQHKDTQKLVDDAVHEATYLIELWKQLPHPTHEEFEAEEREHFEKSLKRQVMGITGALGSLADMGLILDQGQLKELPKGI